MLKSNNLNKTIVGLAALLASVLLQAKNVTETTEGGAHDRIIKVEAAGQYIVGRTQGEEICNHDENAIREKVLEQVRDLKRIRLVISNHLRPDVLDPHGRLREDTAKTIKDLLNAVGISGDNIRVGMIEADLFKALSEIASEQHSDAKLKHLSATLTGTTDGLEITTVTADERRENLKGAVDAAMQERNILRRKAALVEACKAAGLTGEFLDERTVQEALFEEA